MARIELNQPLMQPGVQVARSNVHRFGVFATRSFSEGELIEECPVLIFEEYPSNLNDYVIELEETVFLALGNGTLYNHLQDGANANYQYYPKEEVLRLTAAVPIEAGEEIYINYGNAWFSGRDKEPIEPKVEKPRSGFFSHFLEFLIFAVVIGVIVKIQFFS